MHSEPQGQTGAGCMAASSAPEPCFVECVAVVVVWMQHTVWLPDSSNWWPAAVQSCTAPSSLDLASQASDQRARLCATWKHSNAVPGEHMAGSDHVHMDRLKTMESKLCYRLFERKDMDQEGLNQRVSH